MAKHWSFSFSISPPNEYSGLISFGTDWFDFLVVQGTQESSPTPQFESINILVLSLQVALVVKNTTANAGDIEMRVQSLGWEAPLEEGMAIHSSILAWQIPWTEGLGGLQSIALWSRT